MYNTNRLSAKERYLRDPIFHMMVDTMYGFIERTEMTPTEVREAVILACLMFEERRMRKYIICRCVLPGQELPFLEIIPGQELPFLEVADKDCPRCKGTGICN